MVTSPLNGPVTVTLCVWACLKSLPQRSNKNVYLLSMRGGSVQNNQIFLFLMTEGDKCSQRGI